MKNLKISADVVVCDEDIKNFKKELKDLLWRYSASTESYCFRATTTQNLNNVANDKYKAGRVFKFDENEDIYFVTVQVSKAFIVFMYVPNTIFKCLDDLPISEVIHRIEDAGIQIEYVYRTRGEDHVAYLDDIDDKLTFVDELHENVTAALVSRFRWRSYVCR